MSTLSVPPAARDLKAAAQWRARLRAELSQALHGLLAEFSIRGLDTPDVLDVLEQTVAQHRVQRAQAFLAAVAQAQTPKSQPAALDLSGIDAET